MSPETTKNKLFYGDNYEVLQQHIRDESVDLIYLDPPFNFRQDYTMLFAERALRRKGRVEVQLADSRI